MGQAASVTLLLMQDKRKYVWKERIPRHPTHTFLLNTRWFSQTLISWSPPLLHALLSSFLSGPLSTLGQSKSCFLICNNLPEKAREATKEHPRICHSAGGGSLKDRLKRAPALWQFTGLNLVLVSSSAQWDNNLSTIFILGSHPIPRLSTCDNSVAPRNSIIDSSLSPTQREWMSSVALSFTLYGNSRRAFSYLVTEMFTLTFKVILHVH